MIALLLLKRKLFRTAALISEMIFPAAMHVYIIIPRPGPISRKISANDLLRVQTTAGKERAALRLEFFSTG